MKKPEQPKPIQCTCIELTIHPTRDYIWERAWLQQIR